MTQQELQNKVDYTKAVILDSLFRHIRSGDASQALLDNLDSLEYSLTQADEEVTDETI